MGLNLVVAEISEFEDDEIYDRLYSFVRGNDKNNEYGFEEWDMDYIVEMSELNTSNIYILFDEDTDIIYGVMKVDLFDGYLYLSDILISVRSRGKGYGRHFIEEVMQINNCAEIDLNVDVRNRNAIIFYLKMGFEITGFVSKYYENEFGCIYMMLVKEDDK